MASSVAEVLLRIKAQGYETIDDVAKALQEVDAAQKRAAASADTLDARAETVGQGAQKMAGALGLVSPQAQAAAMAVADLADVVELGGSALSVGAVSALAFAAASVVALAGIGAAGGALVDLTQASAAALPELKELQRLAGVELVPRETVQRIEGAAAALDAAQAGFQATGAAIASAFAPQLKEAATLALQAALALRDIVEQGSSLAGVVVAVGAALAEGLAVPLRGTLALLGYLLTTAADAADALGQDGLAAKLREAGDAARSIADSGLLVAAWDGLSEALSGYRSEAEALVGAQVKINRGLDDSTEKLDRQKAALLEALALFRKWAEQDAEISLAPGGQDIRTAANPLAASLDALTPALDDNLSKVDKLRVLTLDVEAAFDMGAITADQYADALARIAAAYDQINVPGEQLGQILSGVGSITQTASTGSLGSMAEAWGPAIGTAIAGPVGAAVGEGVGTLLSGLEALGAAGGAEGVQAKLDESLANISAGIEALPALVADVLPDLITSLVAEIIPALIELQGRLFVELQMLPLRFVQGFVAGLDQWWQGVGGLEGLAGAVRSGLISWWENAWTTVTGFFRELFGFTDRDKDGKRGLREVGDSVRDFARNVADYVMTGSYATGTDYVPRTGLYKLHQGERVVPAHLRASEGGGEGGSVHLHIQGFSIGTPDQLVRELNRVLGDNGRRLAWRT